MRRRDRCRWHRGDVGIVRPDTAAALVASLLPYTLAAVAGAADALGLSSASSSPSWSAEDERVAMLWLDRGRRLLDGFVVRAGHAEVEEVVAPVLREARVRGSPVGAVVLGSLLPLGRRKPAKAERVRFGELDRLHRAVGLDLVDWFVVGPRRLWSLREEVARMEA